MPTYEIFYNNTMKVVAVIEGRWQDALDAMKNWQGTSARKVSSLSPSGERAVAGGNIFYGQKKADSEEEYESLPQSRPFRSISIFVDGSYRDAGKVGWAFAAIEGGNIIFKNSGCIVDSGLVAMRQVGGELKAAMEAVAWSKKSGYDAVVIHYDYEGIKNWAEGTWKAKNEYTRKYAGWMQKQTNVSFKKTTAHSGWNAVVDEMAKEQAV